MQYELIKRPSKYNDVIINRRCEFFAFFSYSVFHFEELMSKSKTHTIEFKRQVLSYIFEDPEKPRSSDTLQRRSLEATGHMVNKQSIHGWIAQKDQIMEGSITRKRLEGGGPKTILATEFKDIIIGMINEERAEGNRVTGSEVQDWAMQIAENNGIVKFKASNGWLNSFLERNGYSFRRIKNLTALSSEELIKRATNYMQFLQNARDDNLVLQQTILMDETAVYLGDRRRITINESGKIHVSLRITGFSSMRITILLAVSGNGKEAATSDNLQKGRSICPKFRVERWLLHLLQRKSMG